MKPVFIKTLSKSLKKELPGLNAHQQMMIYPNRFSMKNKKIGIPASVLLLLYPQKNDWFFFLTKRSKDVEHHKGQISLPGGGVEKNESKSDAALRETNEEIGIDKTTIDIIGNLTPLYVPVSNFRIYPFVGWVEKKPNTIVHDKEVKCLFSVKLNDLLLEKSLKEKEVTFSNEQAIVPYFDLNNETVWGATSMILSEFKFILEGME